MSAENESNALKLLSQTEGCHGDSQPFIITHQNVPACAISGLQVVGPNDPNKVEGLVGAGWTVMTVMVVRSDWDGDARHEVITVVVKLKDQKSA